MSFSETSNRTADGGVPFEVLKSVLRYDPIAGQFHWTKSRSAQVKAGDIAGSKDRRGYIRIHCGSRSYQAHRLAWLFHYGEWPALPLDHIDRNVCNNAISNLRLATKKQNGANTVTRRGYYFDSERRRWRAEIKAHGIVRKLGRFDTEAQARAAYVAAHAELHGEFSPFASSEVGS